MAFNLSDISSVFLGKLNKKACDVRAGVAALPVTRASQPNVL